MREVHAQSTRVKQVLHCSGGGLKQACFVEQQHRDGGRRVLYRPAGIELGASQSEPPLLSTDGPGTAAASESAGAASWAARKARQLPGTGRSLIGWAARPVTHRVGRSPGRL